MIKAAVVIGVMLGGMYYFLLSTVWDSALGQTYAMQQQYQQAETIANQLATAPANSPR